MLYHIGLFFHMASIILVAGASMAAIFAEIQLWRRVEAGSNDARTFLPILTSAPTLIKVGVVLFLLSGLTMLWSVDWVYLKQPWLLIKLALFISLPLRAALIHGPAVTQISEELNKEKKNMPSLLLLKAKTQRFHIVQYSIVAIIIILAIFKF